MDGIHSQKETPIDHRSVCAHTHAQNNKHTHIFCSAFPDSTALCFISLSFFSLFQLPFSFPCPPSPFPFPIAFRFFFSGVMDDDLLAAQSFNGGIIFVSYVIATVGAQTALELLGRRTHINGIRNW